MRIADHEVPFAARQITQRVLGMADPRGVAGLVGNCQAFNEQPAEPYEVQTVGQQATSAWETIRLRPNEHGFLEVQFAPCRVWEVYPGNQLRKEWSLIRNDPVQITYVLSNATE